MVYVDITNKPLQHLLHRHVDADAELSQPVRVMRGTGRSCEQLGSVRGNCAAAPIIGDPTRGKPYMGARFTPRAFGVTCEGKERPATANPGEGSRVV